MRIEERGEPLETMSQIGGIESIRSPQPCWWIRRLMRDGRESVSGFGAITKVALSLGHATSKLEINTSHQHHPMGNHARSDPCKVELNVRGDRLERQPPITFFDGTMPT